MMDRKAMMERAKMRTMKTNSDQLRREREAYLYAFGLAEEVISEEVCQKKFFDQSPTERKETIGQLFAAALDEGIRTYPPGIFTSGRVVARAPSFFPEGLDEQLDPPRPAAPLNPAEGVQWGDGSKPLPVAGVADEPPAAQPKKRGRPSSKPNKGTQADKPTQVMFSAHSLFSKMLLPGVIADLKSADGGGGQQRDAMGIVNAMWKGLSTEQQAIFIPEALAVKEHHKRFKGEVSTKAIASGVPSELNQVNSKLNAMYFGCPKGLAKGLTVEEKTAYYKAAMPDGGTNPSQLVLVSEMNREQIHNYIKSIPGKPSEPATEEEAIAAAATTDPVLVDSTVIINAEIVPPGDAAKGNVLVVEAIDE